MDILIYLMVFGPMAAAVLSYLIGRKSKPGRDGFVWLTVAAEFLLSLCLLGSAAVSSAVSRRLGKNARLTTLSI